ncbi:UpxY family transcription antiterminator [Candidatus Moduliflexota bacterium]
MSMGQGAGAVVGRKTGTPVFNGSAESVREHSCGMMWYALYVKSRSEFATDRELRSKGIETFLPAVARPRQWKDRRKFVEFPLFPGYIFFRAAAGRENFLSVLKTRGAVTILSRIPGFPTPVPDAEMESLKVVIENGRGIDIYSHLREGTPVIVRRGPLAGAEGTLQRKVDQYLFVVNIELLGRSVGVRIFAEDIDSA